MPLLVVVRLASAFDLVEHKTGSWVRALLEYAGYGDELAGKVNQKLYTTLRDKLSRKLAGSGVEFLIDGGCTSPSEVVLFVSATDLNQKTLSEKKGKFVGFIATRMVTKNFKVNTVEKMLLKKIPAKVGDALQSTGVAHELVVKLVKVYSSEEVEAKVAQDMEQITADIYGKSFLESYARSVFCVFFNTTGYALKLVSSSVVFGAWATPQLAPPDVIGPECSGKWETVSNQMFSGVQGECVYKLVHPDQLPQLVPPPAGGEKAKSKTKDKDRERPGDVGDVSVKISWLNPYFGANLFEVRLLMPPEKEKDTQFVATYQGGHGTNAPTFFRLHWIEEDKDTKAIVRDSLLLDDSPVHDSVDSDLGLLSSSPSSVNSASPSEQQQQQHGGSNGSQAAKPVSQVASGSSR